MTGSARDAEDAMLRRCVQVATGEHELPSSQAEANVFRVASMVIGGNYPAAAQRLKQSAAAYFADHPSEELESAETVRRGWISGLPRLRDRLERRLRETEQGATP